MTRILADFISLTYGFPAKKYLVAAWTILALALVTDGPVLAQTCPANLGDTCPATGTARFETGLHDLAFVSLNKSRETGVFWGDGTQSDALLRCFEPFRHPHHCHVFGTHTYTTPGTYTITISYVPPGPFAKRQTLTTTATISPAGDFVILSIGDSVASGEGDPVVAYGGDGAASQPPEGFWDDPYSNFSNSPFPNDEVAEWPNQSFPCHLSIVAGPAQAALKVQSTNPGITTVHFACSGAKITRNDTPKDTVQDAVGQLRVSRGRLPRIDVLVISAGTNSFTGSFGNGFGELLKFCLFHPLSPCSENKQFKTDVKNSLQALPFEYAKLAQEINCINPDDGTQEPSCTDPQKQIPKLVLITEYMDPTHDQNGNYPRPRECPLLFKLISTGEWQFFHDSILHPLNQQVDKFPMVAVSAGLSVPTYAVQGIEQDFLKHGLCAGDQRWVLTDHDSKEALGHAPPKGIHAKDNGTGHPNGAGQADYRDRIYAAMLAFSPPVTTASATAGDNSYAFGTWTDQDVLVTLSAKNGIQESGVGTTYYAVDDPNCAPGAGHCSQYGAPFTVSTSSQHTVTFFSANVQGGLEASQSVQVLIDKSPPLASTPKQQIVHRGESARYTVTVGHVGWANQTVNLSCKTDAPLATCTMMPASVSLAPGDSNISIATVSTALHGVAIASGAPAQPTPFGPNEALRILLTLATGVFLPAMVLAARRQRFAHVRNVAGLAVLFGLLCTSCGDESRGGTPAGTYNVEITGVSGDTSQTYHAVLIVQ